MPKPKQVKLSEAGRKPKLNKRGGAWDAHRYLEYAKWLHRLEELVGKDRLYGGTLPVTIPYFKSDWTPEAYVDEFISNKGRA